MISIQLWRARIAKRYSGPCSPARHDDEPEGDPLKGSPSGPSSLVLLYEKSSKPTAHSPICDSPPGSSTEKHTLSISHEQPAVYNNSKFSALSPQRSFSPQFNSKTVHSLLSSLTDWLYLPSDLLKDALVVLLIGIISQLLVLSGDVETNPGPIASDKPTMNQLISLKKTDGSGEYLRVIRWIASLSRSECVDFAHLLLVDPVKVRTHQKRSNYDEFVRAVLEDWLSRGDGSLAIPRTWEALADCMEAAGLPGDLVKAIRETCPSGMCGRQVQIEDEDVSMPPAKKPRASPHFDYSEDSIMEHGPIKVVVERDIPKKLLTLMEEYSDMLVVLQTAILSESELERLKLFLSDYCDESSLEDCLSPKELVKQLKAKLRIYIFNIDTLTACCKYFRNDEVSQSIQQYKGHLNTFLSTTSVKEFQSSLQTEVTSHDDAEVITLKLNDTASEDTLMNLKKLVYHFFGNSSKALILYEIRRGCVCVTWIVPASLVSTLRTKAKQLSSEYLASRGVLELVIGLRIVPNEGDISKSQFADAAVLQQFDSSSSQRLEEQQRMDKMMATILKRKASELEAEKNNTLWLEEKCEKQEVELKKVVNESFAFKTEAEMLLEAERKEKSQFEEKYEELKLQLKKVTNEKFVINEKSNELQREVEMLQKELRTVLPMKVQSKLPHRRKHIEQPTYQTMLHHLDAVHSDWFLIGIALKIPHRKLRSLEFLHSHSSSNHCMSEMIYYWLDSPNASWDQVVNALELVGHSELALILKQQYLWDHPTSPKIDTDEVLGQLALVDFPHQLWRKLATGLKLGGHTREFNKGIDATDKLRRLITHWTGSREQSWQQLVDAVAKCERKETAKHLARNVGVIPPE